jgi:trimethylamine---corrinoid protein Co-methyltransferase
MFERDAAPRALTDEQLDAIHAQAIRILQEIGTEVLDERARAVLADAGQTVEDTRVRWDGAFVEEMVQSAPSSFALHGRNPARTVSIGGGRPVLAPVGGSPFASDLDDGRREGSIADHDRLVKLAHAADLLTCLQGGTVEAVDLPVTTRHLDMEYSLIRWSDKPYVSYGTAGWKSQDAIDMAAIAHGGREAIERDPALMIVVNPNSPLIWDTRMIQALLVSAEANQPIVVTPFLLAGGTAPVTMAGALSIQVAEALSGVALAQLVRPGVACLFGSFFTALDMRTGSPAFGMPEAILAILAGRQLADRYGLPYRGGGGFTSANAVDGQGAAESVASLWATMLAGTDFVLHAAGWLEGGLVASYEKLAFDLEVLRQMERIREGVAVERDELAFEAIDEAGPGALFLASPHTMARFKEALYMSPTFLTTDFATWDAGGRQTIEARANQAWKRLLDGYEDPGLDDAVDQELREFMAKRRQEIPEDDE